MRPFSCTNVRMIHKQSVYLMSIRPYLGVKIEGDGGRGPTDPHLPPQLFLTTTFPQNMLTYSKYQGYEQVEGSRL